MARRKGASPPKAAALVFHVPTMSREKIERLIEHVQAGEFTESELANLYDNASERDVSAVMEAIKLKMRADFPRAATRKFGPKEKKAEVLSAVEDS